MRERGKININGKIHTLLYMNYGETHYRYNGRLHRDDGGPAVISAERYFEWWWHGEKHRIDGPAVEKPNGELKWYIHNQLHREDGPAIENYSGINGYDMWYIKGGRHRKDGPAITNPHGYDEWWENGVFIEDRIHVPR